MTVARKLVSLAALAALTVAGPLAAQTVIIGTPDNNNCFPLGCPGSPFNISRYQQVYSAGAFGVSSPVDIMSLTFFNNTTIPPGDYPDATFSIFFSTTSASVSGLSTNLPSNIGTPEALFDILNLTGGTSGPTLTVNGSGYLYDPTMGNLLMDIVVSSGATNGNSFFAPQSDVTGAVTSRAYILNNNATASAEGLVTQFGYTAVTPTPEPTTLVLMATGLAGVAGWTRRRKKTKD